MARFGITLPRPPGADTAPPARKGPGRTRWISIGIVALCLTMAIVSAVYVFKPTSEQTSGVLTYVAPDTGAAGTGDGPCAFPTEASSDVSEIVPTDVTWELVPGSTMAAPRSAAAGPLRVTSGVSACYARTPSGALLAAANFVSEMANVRTDLNALVAAKVVHTTGYDALNQRMQAWLAQDRAGAPTRQIAGYRFLTFDADTATLEIVQRNTSGETAGIMASISYVFKWSEDDWKLVPMIDGSNLPSMRISDLNTPYVPWAGA